MRTISVVVASTSSQAASARAEAQDGASPVPRSGGNHRNVAQPVAIVTHATARCPASSVVQNATMSEK